MTTTAAAILGPGGAIARRLNGYESRPEQLRMAEAVADAIQAKQHLMVEAGTGVGKSFAYLVPAIEAAVERKSKVVISTHTINLQEQLLQKDIPFLRSVLPHEFSAVLVKGRGNYLSLRRLAGAVKRSDSLFTRPEDHDELARIAAWAQRTTDGSRQDLDFKPSGIVWDAIQSDVGNCLGKRCKTYSQCHYFKAKRRAWSANLLVVNHALLVTDLALRALGAGFLPNYDIVILDEAHTFEAVAGEHLGLRLSNSLVEYHLNRLYNPRTNKGLLVHHRLHEAARQVQQTRQESERFFTNLTQWQAAHGTSNGRLRSPLTIANVLGDELSRLAVAIDEGMEGTSTEEDRIDLESARLKCEELADALQSWLTQDEADRVYWIERDQGPRQRITLAAAPVEVGPTLREFLFNQAPSCILTSATLAVGSPPSFTFMKGRLGLTRCRTLQLGSPFDYARQVTIHLPRGLPDPSIDNAEFERRSIGAIRHYLGLTDGRALVLFTSNRHLANAARALTPWLAERNIALFAQTDGMPRSKMVEAFKSDTRSVIFGAESFWQGVDVPGEALSNVVIVRFPFSVPDHPLIEARLEAIQRRGGNRFQEYQVPEAIIKLKQGFGRLVRSQRDRGIVVLLDPRTLTKPYGRQFLDSLPACPRQLDEIPPNGP